MKWIIIGVIFIVIILIVRCKTPNTNVQYTPKDNKKAEFSFKLQESNTVSQTLELITTAINKKNEDPMYLQAYFKGQKTYAKKILTIDLKLYAKNAATGLYDHEIFFKNTYISFDFSSYYYYTYDMGELNYKGNLKDLIYPADLNTETRINNFYVNKELVLNEYPQEVKAVITVKWIDGQQEFSTFLELKEFKSSGKIRTNPFG